MSSSSPGPSRRQVLQGVSTGALVGTAVAACGGGSSGSGGGDGGSTGAAAGTVLGPSSDVPVGGGAVFPKARVVVTQPTSGDFKGFSTRCTHMGCAVSSVADGFIICPCHNSRFAVSDGAPTSDSLAKQPLRSVAVKTQGSDVVLA